MSASTQSPGTVHTVLPQHDSRYLGSMLSDSAVDPKFAWDPDQVAHYILVRARTDKISYLIGSKLPVQVLSS
jgi:hypothetical protein